MQSRHQELAPWRGWMRWAIGVLVGLCLAVPVRADVLRSGQEHRMQSWLDQAALPQGLALGDIAIGKDQVEVQVLHGTQRLGRLLMQPLGAAPARVATSKAFDFSWQGPAPPPALRAWWTDLAARDPGEWWTPPPQEALPFAARRPVVPWQLLLWGPLWLLLGLGLASAAGRNLVGRGPLHWHWSGPALLVGAGAASLLAHAPADALAQAAASLAGPAAVASFGAHPLGALATVWCWHIGGPASRWPWVASAMATLLTAAAVFSASSRAAVRFRTAAFTVASAALLCVAALSPSDLVRVAGAIWLATTPLRSLDARLSALAGAALLGGSGGHGATLLVTAAVWRWLLYRRSARDVAGHDSVVQPTSS